MSGLPARSSGQRRTFVDGRGYFPWPYQYRNVLPEGEFPGQAGDPADPIHRGYARFGDNNIQPDESYPNSLGLYADAYVDAVKEAANVWAVPVIDLNSICGLYPNADSHTRYFHDSTERPVSHPNAEGHYRMAKALAYQLSSYPANFE